MLSFESKPSSAFLSLLEDTGTEEENEFPEEVMMHELGHAILKRDHIYDKLDNGDFKSVMATPYVGWSRNRQKEEYYYDELFDKSQFNTLK